MFGVSDWMYMCGWYGGAGLWHNMRGGDLSAGEQHNMRNVSS